MGGPTPPPRDDESDLTELSAPQLSRVVALVHALVARDRDALVQFGVDPSTDPWMWTRDHGPWKQVELVVPPGPPSTWSADVIRMRTGGSALVIDMWTVEEGRSDLTLECEVDEAAGGDPIVRFLGLHVL